MHYDFKRKMNKLDSQNYRNLLVPEIDAILNEAQQLYVKLIAEPRVKNYLGLEINQRSIDDIKNIVSEETRIEVTNNLVTLPEDYWYYVTSYCEISKNSCTVKSFKTSIRQHEDDFENSPFDRSSYEWRIVNGVFNEKGIKLFAEDFEILAMYITYIRQLEYIHDAKDYSPVGYNLPSGIILTGKKDCILPKHTHREIVDIAVLLATQEIQIPDYNLKRDKLNLNQL